MRGAPGNCSSPAAPTSSIVVPWHVLAVQAPVQHTVEVMHGPPVGTQSGMVVVVVEVVVLVDVVLVELGGFAWTTHVGFPELASRDL